MIINSNRNILSHIPPNAKIVSFDLFDTLVIRKTDPPDEVIKITSSRISQEGLINLSGKKIYKLRNEIENELREKHKKSGLDSECSIEEIYSIMIKKTKTNCSVKDLLDIELNIETNLLLIMPGIKKILDHLKNDYRLIVISDTYYPLWMIEHYLLEVGLHSYFNNIYCSCEYGLNKGSGRLFEKVLTLEGVFSEQIVHLGDNVQCDYLLPKTLGVPSLLLLNSWNLKRRSTIRLLNNYESKGEMWKASSFFNKLLIENPLFEKEKNGLFSWGKEVVGPLIVLFVHLFINQCIEKKITKIFFLARDGFVLKKIYNQLSKEIYGGKLPSTEYLCVSRYSTFAASIKKMDQRVYRHAISGDNMTVGEILKRFKLDLNPEIKNLLEKYNLLINSSINDSIKKKIRLLFKDQTFKKIVLENSNQLRIVFRKYLESHSFFSKSKTSVLVDIGWLGTIQDNIDTAFSNDSDYPNLTGYYLASTQASDYQKNGKNKIGLLYDYKNAVPEQASISFFMESLEFSTRALHGTTTGYKYNKNHDVTSIFKKNTFDRQNEKQNNKDILLIQKGIYQFLHEYIQLQKVYAIKPELLEKYVTTRYDNYINFPRKRHLCAIENMGNADDFGRDKVRNIVSYYSIKDIFSPKKMFSKFIDSPWREASISKTKIPFLNILYLSVKRIIIWNRIGKQVK